MRLEEEESGRFSSFAIEMLIPSRRVRYSIDALQKNIYDYHHGAQLSLSNNSLPKSLVNSPRRCEHLIQFIEDSCTIIQAIFVRVIFILSTILTVWRLVEETKETYYWYLLLLLLFLLIETYATVYTRKGVEYKWFCPSAFTYLIAIVPCIWLLELHHSCHMRLAVNQTRIINNIPRLLASVTYPMDFDSDSNENRTEILIRRKQAMLIRLTTTRKPDLSLEKLLKTPQEFMSKLSIDEWHMIIEQMILLILILSRWLLPKGELTREELSQLLLVYIGIAADIVEFFEVFKEYQVRENRTLSILVLSLWTLSLLQFCLAFTISRGRKSRFDVEHDYHGKSFCNPSDFWGMLISLLLQDIPFFSFRAVLIFRYHILSYSTVFFTSKNGLIIILQWYRITVILAATISQQRQSHQQRKSIPMISPNRTLNFNDGKEEV